MYKFIFLLIVTFIISCSPEIDDSPIIEDEKIEVVAETTIIIEPSILTIDSINMLEEIDSIHHLQILKDFPKLQISKIYGLEDPLRELKTVQFFDNTISHLIIQSNMKWGIQVYSLNYDKNNKPLSAYEIAACGGDGGYYSCSKTIIKGPTCKTITESGEPISEDDYSQTIKTLTTNTYNFTDSLNLELESSTSQKDTL